MCPGIAVLGGGGDGGDGDGSGNGGKDGAGGDGNGNGEGAGGDGKDGSGCGGGGSGGSCNIHQPSMSAGDPVDVVTGRVFTNPVLDLGLRGPLPLAITRCYSSGAANRDVGLGYGWNHSLGWELELHAREIRLWKPGGTCVRFPDLEPGEQTIGHDGYLLRRDQHGYALDLGDDLVRVLVPADSKGKRYRLSLVRDRNGNQVTLDYADGRLVQITDSVGRVVRVSHTAEGRIASLAVQDRGPGVTEGPWVTFVTYTYDELGDLIGVRDRDGHFTGFAYEDHRLTRHAYPTGLTYQYVYDAKGRCIETWGDYPGHVDPSIADGVSRRLADGTTPVKGVLHCRLDFGGDGYSEVTNSVTTQRFFGNRFGKLDKAVSGGNVTTNVFDERGFVISRTNPLMATTLWKRDERGRILAETDAMGRETIQERDAAGRVLKAIEPNGAVTAVTYDTHGNPETIVDPVGGVRSYRHDERGLLVEYRQENGGVMRFEYDAHCNWTRATAPNGGVWQATYDAWGRRVSLATPTGGVFRYQYDADGDMIYRQDPRGGVTRYEYDGMGQLTRAVDPDGRAYEFVWGGHRALAEIKKPDGSSIRYRYNWEGWLVEIWNERGEVYRFEYDAEGAVTAETRFDGSKSRYLYDAVGQVIRHIDTRERRINFEYDLTGNLLCRAFDDDSEEKFEYDAIGEVVSGINGHSKVTFERDLLGRVVREIQECAGETHTVESRFDSLGDRVLRRTSLGHTEEVERDVMGFRGRVVLDATEEIKERHDVLGGRLEQWLPGGGLIEQAFDLTGFLIQQRATSADQRELKAGMRATPDRAAGPANVHQAFRYSPAGELIGAWDQERGTITYEYDPIGRLLAALPERARAEAFRYDATGNLYETGGNAPGRGYDKGNRILRRGESTYRWNDDGQLIEKREVSPGGDSERVWSYTWNERGLLSSVKTPDSVTTEFLYDAFARRLVKHVKRPTDTSGDPDLLTSRYVWDGDSPVHERRTRRGDVLLDRTYCFARGTFVPYAHGERRGGGERTWFFYLNDPAGSPDTLVDARGEVACRMERTVWGKLVPAEGARTITPFRFQGQYDDEETGLSYNRFRYYDPELGRYISRDPLSPDSGLNGFDYGRNPLTWIDPFGMTGRGTHYADMTITRADGSVRAQVNDVDSHMTPAQLATYHRSMAQDTDGHPAASEMRRACHTERKMCDPPDGLAYQNGVARGDTVRIKGKYDPCKKCRDSMTALSKDKKCTVHYTPGVSGKPGTAFIVQNGQVLRED
jgi:RHS repeat-associated protein